MSNGSSPTSHSHDPGPPPVPHDIEHASDRYLLKLKSYARALPYSIEPNSRMQGLLDLICIRIVQAVQAKDYDPGFLQWDSMLTYWSYLKYPIPKEKRILLVDLYYSMCTTPGMPLHIVATCSDALEILTRSKNKLSIQDIRLPWSPVFDILRHDLFLTRRQFEVSQTSYYMGMIASIVQRFFHPAAIDQMLETFLPLINGTHLNSLLSSQFFMLTFLPQSHPQSYLPMLFRLWEPSISDPRRIGEIPDDARLENEGRPNWAKDDLSGNGLWTGIYKDVGIFSDYDWHFIMSLYSEIPLADSGSLTTGPSADNQAGFEIGRLPKPTWRIASLARIIVYSMAPDGLPAAPSSTPTPLGTPLASGMNTPRHPSGSVGDYLTAPLGKLPFLSLKSYVGGSKALDSLVKLIASTESFFHPSNSGAWTADLTAFIKYVAYEFNKRWHEEQRLNCKTPMHHRLTRGMKRELVKSFRTVALLAMFSEDSTTANNISSCLKWMSLMEPDLILYPILERAVPSLEALVEVSGRPTIGAIAPALVSREVYYPGAKHLVPILQLLIPGIDLNDPSKTLCTTTFLIEISQYIKFGDLTSRSITMSADVDSSTPANVDIPNGFSIAPLGDEHIEAELIDGPSLSKDEEDALLRESTAGFPDWIASFIRRVILLFDNLPEEAGGATEVQLVDAVTNACSQICIHLSDSLFDLVLNMIFDYASTNVRPNAVRAVHQLVECVANAHPAKTLAKFVPFCIHNIEVELENGASSTRTTSTFSTPLPSDATFHWNLAVLRGAMFKWVFWSSVSSPILKHKDQFIPLLKRLLDKTFSKRGFSWSGKLLSSLLLTLTHTYPLEDKFVNGEEWDSEEFRFNHHKYWGKLYTADDVTVSWHVPHGEELNFAMEIFREIVEPTLERLEKLLEPGTAGEFQDSVAPLREASIRYLSFVRNAFSGTPTFVKEVLTKEDQQYTLETSDILNEIPEMIASIEPLNSGFAVSDPRDPRAQYYLILRQRFGRFLHEASASLRQQGEENTVDAVHALIQSIRTYLLDYGDSKDSYYVQSDRYGSELSYARQYTKQKLWPRAVFIRRSRLYHAARLRWNSIERRRTPTDDQLIDDVAEWALWHYATVRESSQSLLDSLCGAYDGIRRRCLPLVYAALEPGTEDDRMKGALWTLNSSAFEPTLAPGLLKKLFGCQANEKPSIQSAVSSVCENGINSFVEPNFHVYDVNYPRLDRALANFQSMLPFSAEEESLVIRCRERRISRIRLCEERVWETRQTSFVLEIAQAKSTHWRYAIFATRCLRTLVRKDSPISALHMRYFLEMCHDNHPSLYSQRAVMKAIRYIKLRTFAQGPIDLIFERNNNPLKQFMKIRELSHDFTHDFLAQFQSRVDLITAGSNTLFIEDVNSGWLAWQKSQAAISVVRDAAKDPSFWRDLSTHFSSETHSEVVSSDNVASVKSIVQLLEDESFAPLQNLIEELILNPDQNKQRGAAEFMAGLLNVHSTDYNGESSLNAVKSLCFFRAFYEEQNWKFSPWVDQTIERVWAEISSEHDEVRAYISELLAFASKIKRQPKPSIPSAEVFVRECRTTPIDFDILGMRGNYHRTRVQELVQRFPEWRAERLPGSRAFQSTYDKVATTTCRWLFQTVHDTNAISAFDYILPLMPELFRFTEVNDNDELLSRARMLLVRMCGVTPPRPLIGQILHAIFDTILNSPSWKVRMQALPLVQVFYFRQVPLLSDARITEILEVLCKCLDDEVVEVREMAATTLSGVLRVSPRRSQLTLKDRFVKLLRRSPLPSRQSPVYNAAIRQRHAAILGICALIDSYPYTVERWMPELLANVLAEHAYDPVPISLAVQKCASNFKKTHQDTWHEDSKRFTEDQLAALSTLLTGSSYYAVRALVFTLAHSSNA
ncbi:hypothetical protein B0F90DRAFT_1813347 [Multifurca ochricompacta]|uniref:Proteasome activator subunit 4 n=1 Tax=Multifurca ochricompacta TaxID=376703 RepID=A0AAD4MDB3_9AGAM|nr:hypothetical protein B0F90DRAFT_1813347 [Multifurca ochricompacta]